MEAVQKTGGHQNTITFFYVKDLSKYIFNVGEIKRIPYMTPGLVGPQKAAKGKIPTNTWWLSYSQNAYQETNHRGSKNPLTKRIFMILIYSSDTEKSHELSSPRRSVQGI